MLDLGGHHLGSGLNEHNGTACIGLGVSSVWRVGVTCPPGVDHMTTAETEVGSGHVTSAEPEVGRVT